MLSRGIQDEPSAIFILSASLLILCVPNNAVTSTAPVNAHAKQKTKAVDRQIGLLRLCRWNNSCIERVERLRRLAPTLD